MDIIDIDGLQVRCILGLNAEERREKQDVVISVALEANLQHAGRSDQLEDTVDYSAVKKAILRMAEDSQFTLAERLAQEVADICLAHPLVRRARVRVEKPTALRFARNVAVTVIRLAPLRPRPAYISLGSNLQPVENIRKALTLLAQKVTFRKLSTIYLTPADGRPEQPEYFNTMVAVNSRYPPLVLKYFVLKRIEEALGRHPGGDRYSARTIDLDLVCFDHAHLATPELTLPDPEILRRPYMAFGLQELSPGLEFPGWHLTIEEITAAMSKSRMKALPEYTEKLRKDLLHGETGQDRIPHSGTAA